MQNDYTMAQFVEAANLVQKQMKVKPAVGIVLGSGLGQLADEVQSPVVIDYHDIPGWPVSTVPGHKGRLVIGMLNGVPVLMQQGRAHFYEGYTPQQTAFGVRVMKVLGIENIILTNAAGGINKGFSAGDVMLITDHIGFVAMAGHNPLAGGNYDEIGPRFPDMSRIYDREFCQWAREAAKENNLSLQEGVYAWVSGPNYESPAEVRMLRLIGVDAVGMSTVPEAIAARHAGMRILAFSGITNQCSDNGEAQTTHQEVLEAADQIGPKIIKLLKTVIVRL